MLPVLNRAEHGAHPGALEEIQHDALRDALECRMRLGWLRQYQPGLTEAESTPHLAEGTTLHKITKRLTLATAAPLLAVALVATAGSASAAPAPRDTIHVLNETSGSFAMRDANNSGSTGNPIVEGAKGVFGPATDFQWQDLGTQSSYNGVTRENGEIFLLQHPGLCLGSATGGFIITANCTRGTGTVVAEVPKTGAITFESRLYSDAIDGNQFVTGDGNSGQLSFEGTGNNFQRWTAATGTG